MLSSQSRHGIASRKHDSRHHESDSDRPRQPIASGQRYTAEYGTASAIPDRQHRSRRADVSGNPMSSEPAPTANKYPTPRDQSFASGHSYHASFMPQAPLVSLPAAPAGEPSSSARPRAHELSHEPDVHVYARRRTERQSPRSSEERLLAVDPGKPSRSSRQPATGYTSTPLAGLPVNSSSLYQSNRDPASSSRHPRDRDRDREKDRERRREREREKERVREEEERVRARAVALEKEFERQKRREEKEVRRAEREKEKERERRREEKELERVRRHREKEKAREHELRMREEPRGAVRNSFYAQHPSTTALKYMNGSSDQVPSSSSNIALPSTVHLASAPATRPTTGDLRRDDNYVSSQAAPPHVPDKDRKSRRSRREKTSMQQHGQESGMSSSEQEQSGRERASLRTIDRRYARRDTEGDAHGSGPSGSENERASYKQRKYRAPDPYTGYRPNPYAQANGAVPPPVQYSATVGPVTSQYSAPRVVSIRAGQGPADPEAPVMRTKPPFTGQPQVNPPYSYPATAHGVIMSGNYQPNSYIPSSYAATPQAPTFAPTTAEPIAQTTYVAARPSPHQIHQNLVPKVASGTPPSKAAEPPVTSDAVYTPASYAKFNVYRSPGPAVTAEVSLPTSQQPPQTQFVTVNSTTVKDLAAKFPLNEDFLTSASSSTLDMGTGRSAPGLGISGQGAPQVVDLTEHNQSNRSGLPETWLHPHQNATKPSGQAAYLENDVPLPVPGPRGVTSTPAFTQRDLRPMQQAIPISHASQQASRPPPTPLQPKPPAAATPAYLPAHMAPGMQPAVQKGVPPNSSNTSATLGIGNASSNSPARSMQQPLQRSPSTLNAVPLGTPRQSSSIRLKGRNGSSDTVVYPGSKASPSQSMKPITHRTSNTNLQVNASSRPDTIATRHPPNVSTEYPDMSRYRAAPSAAYPLPPHTAPVTSDPPAPYSQQPTQPQPSQHQHSRSASQPTVSNPYDFVSAAPRSQTLPTTAPVPPSPAAASSASAIAAAYRSGLYTTETSNRASDKRVPPRAAPLPAPVYQPQPVKPPSIFSKTGYALPTNPPPSSRVQATLAPPATGRTNNSYATTTHGRNQSEPVNTILSTRVAISGHPSTPAPTKAQLTSPSEQELLMTPSSLAPSMLKGGQAPFPSSRQPQPQPLSKPPSTKDSRKKGGLFALFRSRSSPPKQDARVAEAIGPEPVGKPRQRSTSQTTINAVAASVRNIIAPHPNPNRGHGPPAQNSSSTQKSSTSQPRSATVPPQGYSQPPPAAAAAARVPASARPDIDMGSMRRMAAPHAPAPVHPSAGPHYAERRSPGSKMFTPFRLISKRHRTVSAASNEAADGTATNTVIGGESARSSTAGRLSPPLGLRDPLTAAQEWRNNEEAELRDRGTYRRRRPGVVFDVSAEFTDTETYHVLRKASRQHS